MRSSCGAPQLDVSQLDAIHARIVPSERMRVNIQMPSPCPGPSPSGTTEPSPNPRPNKAGNLFLAYSTVTEFTSTRRMTRSRSSNRPRAAKPAPRSHPTSVYGMVSDTAKPPLILGEPHERPLQLILANCSSPHSRHLILELDARGCCLSERSFSKPVAAASSCSPNDVSRRVFHQCSTKLTNASASFGRPCQSLSE